MSEITISAPARLHLGMLDPAGLGARRFGGFGVGLEWPRVVVSVRPVAGGQVQARGPQAQRAAQFACQARAALGLTDGLEVVVHEAIPAHQGLGSGTKLGLAVARAVSEIAGMSADPVLLARLSGRGMRSSVGCWTFAGPGLVVEGGVREDGLGPLIARVAMPERWRCVLVLPRAGEGLSGEAEERFFARREELPKHEPSVARLLLTALLPGLQHEDIEEFGAALSAIQREVGTIFAAQQGGIFHPCSLPVVRALSALGAQAVGQSSWGPTVYGIAESPERAAQLAAGLQNSLGAQVDVHVVDFDRSGAILARGDDSSVESANGDSSAADSAAGDDRVTARGREAAA
jgi:beta-ribofuranosylaminobenzene 5'-phosphate synthase